MIYLIGGAPRVGKSTLAQQVAASLKSSWISTDPLLELLRVGDVAGVKTEWNAKPEAIAATAEWFYPYLERFVWSVESLAADYVIEGVDFLPEQVARLSAQFQVRTLFLGCSKMTRKRFDQFPGRSRGYANLPEELKRQIVEDVPLWSAFVGQEAQKFGYPYVDTEDDFLARLVEAEGKLLTEN
ncbi:hypothetical protein [Candidatus Leptofilum sp.]|uniref:hypothetical protein n=1 Tax=Candidatus Leptofilum sp. TaxID=3241576 RepID=UPI003B58E49C